jgi:fatty-acyl-CoA synthase
MDDIAPRPVEPAAAETPAGRTYLHPINGLSHVKGTTAIALWRRTISDLFKESAALNPDRDAIVFKAQDIRWSWTEFDAKIDQLAAGLKLLGLTKGDRAGIWAPNRAEWVLVQFATARLGIILVNINPAYRLYELEYALNKSGCTALILADRYKTSDYVGMIQELAPELADAEPGALSAAKLPNLKWVVRMGETRTPGMLGFDELMDRGADPDIAALDAISASLDPDDPINIQFTSGTTGNPKGATLTHNNIVNNARYTSRQLRMGPDDKLCIPVPMYHCFGMVLSVLVCVASGAGMVYPGETFEPSPTLAAVHEERCTVLHGVPTMFVGMLGAPDLDDYDLTSLRTGLIGGAPVPMEVMRQLDVKLHLPEMICAYGMTETSPVSFLNHTDDPLERRVSTVGRVTDQLECKIIDANGKTVPVGEQGEICTRGYSVMPGYWEDEENTRAAIDADGFMHTGDLGAFDEEGYCRITGRVKDMLIRGGENIYPREIEEFLFTHPKVQNVQVFGIPDAKYGEEACAWIVLKEGEDATVEEILEFCQGQITHFKIPRYIRFKDELPLTVTGKPQKFIMRNAMVDELGL